MGSESSGQIITFYSYKGGTGRTMSLANIACILAERQKSNKGKNVLMIDWDLEAPGLHRFFQDKIIDKRRISEESYEEEPGLIDLFYELNKKLDGYLSKPKKHKAGGEVSSKSEALAYDLIDNINFDKYISPTGIDNLYLLKAGRFNSKDSNEYPEKVNKFNWEALYEKSPPLIRLFADTLAKKYAYVLIDSRTGITDISGVCTALLPEKLVIVFTPNTQSIKGAMDVVQHATDYRKASADLRPLVVFPFVSRVETTEPILRRIWRRGNRMEKITGYQPAFQNLLANIYVKEEKKSDVDLEEYFNEMQIPHIPRYAFGEKIALLDEGLDDKFSLRLGYKTFTNKLIEDYLPWEGEIEHPPRNNKETASEEEIALQEKIYRLNFWSKWLLSLVGINFTKTLQTVLAISAILITLAALIVLYGYRQTTSELATVVKRNEELQQQIDELQRLNATLSGLRPVIERKDNIIREKDINISQLYEQLNASGSEKDKTILDLQQQLKDANANLITANRSSQAYQTRAERYLNRALFAETKIKTLELEKQELEKGLAACKAP